VRYKSGCQHTLPDIISRLISAAIFKHDDLKILALLAITIKLDGENILIFLTNIKNLIQLRSVKLFDLVYHITIIELAESEKKTII